MINVYGISNCDTVRKSLKWLEARHISYEFHDFKTFAPSKALLEKWMTKGGWEKVLNNKSTMWRALNPEQKATITTENEVIKLLQANPTAIKRPVVEWTDGSITLGFDEQVWSKLISEMPGKK